MRALIVLCIVMIGCTKKDAPQPTPPTPTPIHTPYNYLTNGFIDSNLVGNYNIYKETHTSNDSTYQYYPPTITPIYFTTTTIQYNPPSTPIPYTYSNYTITSSLYNYIVIDMSEDTNWLYIRVIGGSYIQGFDTMYYSLSRI